MTDDLVRTLATGVGAIVLVAALALLGHWIRPLGSERVLRAALVASAVVPAGWVAAFYAFVLRARLQLGDWPRPYQPDPKALGFHVHHALLWLGLVPCALAPYVWLAAALIGWRSAVPRRVILLSGAGLAACETLFLGLSYLDPGAFAEWFAD